MTFTLYGPRFSVGPFFFSEAGRNGVAGIGEKRGLSPAARLLEG